MGRKANRGQGLLKKGKHCSIKNGGGACGGCSEDRNECMPKPSLGLGHSSGMMEGTLDWPSPGTRTVSQRTPSATLVWLGSAIKGPVSTQQHRKPEPHGQGGRPFPKRPRAAGRGLDSGCLLFRVPAVCFLARLPFLSPSGFMWSGGIVGWGKLQVVRSYILCRGYTTCGCCLRRATAKMAAEVSASENDICCSLILICLLSL